VIDRRGVGVACLAGLLAVAGVSAETPEDAAQAATESWLRLVDAGDYAGSWSHAARALKAVVAQADWQEAAEAIRAPLGPLASRKIKSREFTEKAPATRTVGGRVYTWGPGRYVVLQYDAAFGSRPSAVELAIATVDPDGVWRVAAYSVR
jgi:hypothetical protein